MKQKFRKLYYREYTRDEASGKQKTKWVPTSFYYNTKTGEITDTLEGK